MTSATGLPWGKDGKANFSSMPSGPREPLRWDEKRKEGREGRRKGEMEEEQRKTETSKKKKKDSNFGKPRSSE